MFRLTYDIIFLYKKTQAFLFLWLLFLPLTTSAVVVADLYQATVPVASHSQKDFQQALIQAYKQVLVKASGDQTLLTLPEVQRDAKTLSSIVQRYSYHVTAGAYNEPELLLKISFDASSIRQILQEAGKPSWGKNRPLTVVWLVYNNDQGLMILNNDAGNDMLQTIERSSELRGVPILVPIMDLQDMDQITPQDVWVFNIKNLEQASMRYHTNAILAGRIYRITSNEWSADWLWLLDNQPVYWQTQGQTKKQIVNEAIDDLASALAQRYAVLSTGALKTDLTIKILNVINLNQYSLVMHYLKSLTPVSKIELLDIQPQDVEVRITITGSKQDLIQVLNQQQAFRFVQAANNNKEIDLTLEWQGNRS